jgi:predicted DNA-binding transcriptional regulator AlpA
MTDPPVGITRCAQPGAPVPGGCSAPGAWTTVARTVAVRATVPPWCPPGGRPAAGTAPSSRRGGYRPASTRGSTGPGVKPAPGHGADDLTRRAEWRLDACGPGRQASPPRRPAPGPAASTCNGEDAPEVTARDHPAPAPAGLPLRQGRAALLPRRATRPRGLSPFPVPPDLTGRAERSVRRRGPTDGPSPGTQTAPGRPPATPDAAPGTPGDPLLTIKEVTTELRVSRAAFYCWRRQRVGPPVVRLPGGGVRVRRSALTAWLRQLEDTQDGQEQGAKWTATTSGSGTSRSSATAPQPGSGSGGPWTGASTASRSRPAPSPTGSSTA